MRLGAVLAACLLAAAPVPALAQQRVVSMNLCTDQLVLHLLPPERIASVSRLAADPELSIAADRVGDIPLNDGMAEEVMAYQPDLVIAGQYTTRATVGILEKFGVPVYSAPLPQSIAESMALVAQMGEKLGAQGAAEKLLRGYAAMPPLPDDQAGAPRALVLDPNGFTAGAGTLVDEIIQRAGLVNAATQVSSQGHGRIALEAVLLADIDVLIVQAEAEEYPSLATQMLHHAALQQFGRRVVIAAVPSRLWMCGGPEILQAMQILSDAAKRARRGGVR